MGSIRGEGKLGSGIAPYLGIGFGTPISPGLGFNFDLGVMFPGSPSVTLTNVGADPNFVNSPVTAPAYQQFLTDLKEQEAKTNKDISGFRIYPVLSLGISYAF